MAFDPDVPQNSDSPSLFPAQNRENMARLQTIVGADHQFNLATASNDGYHNLIHMTVQAPTGVLASTGRSYVKSSASRVHQFYMDDQGTEYQITPTLPIRAAVRFLNNGTIVGTAYNVSGVVHAATGVYTVTFATPLPDANYMILLSSRANGTEPNTSYWVNASSGAFQAVFGNKGSTNVNVTEACAVIFSIT